jgi:membrane-associated phospholipid phosphatase
MRAPFKLLPGEWVLGAFLAYAVGRLVAAGDFTLNQRSVPRSDFVIVFLLVLASRSLVAYRRVPWPKETAGQRRLHFTFLALFAVFIPLVLPAFPRFRPVDGWEGAASELFLALYGWAQVVLLVVLPFALFWLASAQHIKAHGRLDSIGMVRERWRGTVAMLRDWVPIAALLYCYGLMGPVIGRGLFGDQDAALARIDRVMFFGHDPRVLCEALISRPLSEWLCACYVFYLPLFPIVLAWVFAKKDPAPFRELGFAVTLTLAVGYVFYTIVPAQGPLFLDHFDVSLDAYLGARLKAQLMDRTRVPRDCFPSLHTGVSLTLLWGAFRHVRPLFWVLAPIVLSIPFACVYLRYHYVIDVIAGIALFAGVATLTVRSERLQAAFRRGASV